ncbi:GAF and ANTAR domain-containing protein [Couchioplanes caeruleus]|uniref:ANTAR domain-containing protein n=2 Tax=Couchioplanes caeruleus TaxID=56438 RepID=A0A1K0GPK7_9ACTN|nr:GAF and ANTAR domain-containing protein [Couchioplanes caeruleus]OJF11179.1 hypothetical protein BG844_28140 [Couchioplanes caeruleus subsp. caeruleus]ROP30879.1 GAF domain-containing protein [Couchioplanes caeruleus]
MDARNFDETSLDDALAALIERGRQTIGAADEISVTLLRGNYAHTPVVTSNFALLLDEWQYEQGQGPCLDAAACAATVTAADLTTESRWPRWTRRAVEAGAASCASVGLRLPDGIPGSLNLYARRPAAFDTDAMSLAQGFAGSAAVLLAPAVGDDPHMALSQHRHTTMQHRAVIERAKNIVMSRTQCSPDDAFALLAQQAQATGRATYEVATTLIHDAHPEQ